AHNGFEPNQASVVATLGKRGAAMRAREFLLILCLVFPGANYAFAQGPADDPPLQFDPYNKHHDRHLGHNHVYPDRGSVFRDAPKGSITVNYAGLAYRFYNGVWF